MIITALAHPHLAAGLQKMGYAVDMEENITYDQLMDTVPRYQGLVVSTRIRVDARLIDRATSLKWIGRLGSGMEIIDVDHAQSKGISCISSPEGNCDAVGEWCLATLIGLMRNLHSASEEVKAGQWIREANRGFELRGKTVGIIGYGHTGSAFASLLEPFKVTVLAHDKYRSGFANGYVKEVSALAIAEQADVISFHLPLKEETRHFANVAYFEAMKRCPVILNSSRGNVVDTVALVTALGSEKVAAAGLDVLENEDLSSYSAEEKQVFEKLVSHPRVMITPHIAGYSHEALYKMASVLLGKVGTLQNTPNF